MKKYQRRQYVSHSKESLNSSFTVYIDLSEKIDGIRHHLENLTAFTNLHVELRFIKNYESFASHCCKFLKQHSVHILFYFPRVCIQLLSTVVKILSKEKYLQKLNCIFLLSHTFSYKADTHSGDFKLCLEAELTRYLENFVSELRMNA